MSAGDPRQRVIVGVDGSEGALAAVRWAAQYAAEVGEPLQVVHVAGASDTESVVLPVPVGVSNAGLRPGPSSDQILENAVDEAAGHAPDLEVTARTISGDAVPALVEVSAEAGLLVLGSRDRGRLAAALFGSVADRVTADARCPVVVVRGTSEPTGPVVVAVDASGGDGQALQFAFREATRRRCAVLAVHAWQPPLTATGPGTMAATTAATGFMSEELPAAARQALNEAVAPWRAAFPDVTVHERLLEGHPEVVVADRTDKAALIVVGTRGRRPLTGLLFGSTSQALLHRADCPVAVVREPDDQT
ncbi:universal stress protein [Actinoplanes sp. NBC_00393]|uniref:universal stress protein n=1 Tax=Actinoplanes sp. NBC_00393 TaxID=2975953 RepID=UPI002E1E6DB9